MNCNSLKNLTLFALIFIIGLFTSCSKDDSDDNGNSEPIIEKTVLTQENRISGDAVAIDSYNVDIYIAGYQSNARTPIATSWKNQTATELTSESEHAYATSVMVKNEDVYIAGWKSMGSYNVATYWKNGIEVVLNDETQSAKASSIFIDNGEIYVSGEIKSDDELRAVYWKNGQLTELSNLESNASKILVHNNDIYVCGFEHNGETTIAKYWKNGNAVSIAENARALDMAVQGSDIHVIGFGDGREKYWKNGEEVDLLREEGETASGRASGIFIDNSDVYVIYDIGFTGGYYWKNGKRNTIEKGADINLADITVENGIIHVVGYDRINSFDQPIHWKITQ